MGCDGLCSSIPLPVHAALRRSALGLAPCLRCQSGGSALPESPPPFLLGIGRLFNLSGPGKKAEDWGYGGGLTAEVSKCLPRVPLGKVQTLFL